ncbi:MAG: GSCFA domain-containing protein [Deltaproteobacteria bacterium]|jgi:hypothetical protein|nr:GSCFA domain-containing protein [Deltaproteobacteria bacterium]
MTTIENNNVNNIIINDKVNELSSSIDTLTIVDKTLKSYNIVNNHVNDLFNKSITTNDSNERKELLEKSAKILYEAYILEEQGENKSSTEIGLKIISIYLTLALEYKHNYAYDGLKIILLLRKSKYKNKITNLINYYDSIFNLLAGNYEISNNLFSSLVDLNIPYYSFNNYNNDQYKSIYNNIFNLIDISESKLSEYTDNKNKIFKNINNIYPLLTGIGIIPNKGSETPYNNFSSDTHFWKTAVANRMPAQLGVIYNKKFSIDKSIQIMSAGSCFAQHIGTILKENGFNFMDYEPLYTKKVILSNIADESFGYNLYSARYGNIYTVRQLKQLLLRSLNKFNPIDEFWEQNGRFYDPYRPTIEPFGFYSLKEARVLRKSHLAAVKRLFTEADLLIFTMGLTECWQNKEDGAVYPICPGAAAGVFDGEKYEFINLKYKDIVGDLHFIISELKEINPKIKLLLTVSPVPLTATASEDHVLVATMKSKAILRAVSAEIYDNYEFVDYFPSYDIISSTPFGRGAFAENLRQVKPELIKFVMSRFLAAHGFNPQNNLTQPPLSHQEILIEEKSGDEICDEILLEAFNK